MSRRRLPDRRQSVTFDVTHGTHKFNVSISFADDEVAEIFVTTPRRENDLTAMMRDAAVLTSIALQFGAPLATLRHALTRLGDGKTAASPIGSAIDAAAAVAATREREMR